MLTLIHSAEKTATSTNVSVDSQKTLRWLLTKSRVGYILGIPNEIEGIVQGSLSQRFGINGHVPPRLTVRELIDLYRA